MLFGPSDPDPVLFSTDPNPQCCGSDLIAFRLKYTISEELKFNICSVVKRPTEECGGNIVRCNQQSKLLHRCIQKKRSLSKF